MRLPASSMTGWQHWARPSLETLEDTKKEVERKAQDHSAATYAPQLTGKPAGGLEFGCKKHI